MDYPRVSIVFLNWNKAGYAIRCLESIYQITYPNYDVIVFDNGSKDDSIDRIKAWAEGKVPVESKFCRYDAAGKPVDYVEYQRTELESSLIQEDKPCNSTANRKLIIIRNQQNCYYALACNFVMKYSFEVLNAEYVLLTHNDCVVSSSFIDELVRAAREEPDAGILGSKIYSYRDPDGELWSHGGLINYWTGTYVQRGPRLAARAKGQDAVAVDWVPLCCALISRKMCRAVGLLDEAFPYGLEELDICLRAAKGGFRMLFVPKSIIWHDDYRPPEYNQDVLPLQIAYFPKNQLILLSKHWHGLRLVSATLFFVLRYAGHFFNFLLHSRKWSHFKLAWRGLRDYWRERKNYR